MTPTVSTLSEMPEPLYHAIQSFLTSHPTWDSDRLVSASIALFLSVQATANKGRVVVDGSSSGSLFGDESYSELCDRFVAGKRTLAEIKLYDQAEKRLLADPQLYDRFIAEANTRILGRAPKY